MNYLNLASLLAEIAVTTLGVLIASQKRKSYGWLIAITFGIYVIYDSSRFFAIRIPKATLEVLFFVASISILMATWHLYRKGK